MGFNYFDIYKNMVTALEDLSRVLEMTFPGWDVTLERGQIYSVQSQEYHVWVSKTMIRNHADVLDKINVSRAPPGIIREWVRHGYIVAVDYCVSTVQDAVLTRVEVN